MTRPLRLAFENAVYHITARGNRQENIFYSEGDKRVFLDKMNETFEKYSFICYAYCLMDNHYHLFIKTPVANVSNGMHYLNSSYANWLKAKYKIIGVVFQGRYQSILVDEDSYALELSAYIHLNPLRAGMVRYIEEYPWSSFLDYVGTRRPLVDRLDTSLILSQLDRDVRKAGQRYKGFVLEQRDIKSPFKDAYRGFIFGSEVFIEEVQERIQSIGIKREIRETNIVASYRAEEIIDKISEACAIKRDKIFDKQKGNMYRPLALYLLKRYSTLSLKEIGALFAMDYTAVSQAAKRFEQRLKTDTRIMGMKDAAAETLGIKGMSNGET